MPYAKSIEEFFEKSGRWRSELQLLYDIINETELEPALKWGIPNFCLDGKNLIGIAGFKEHFGIWFHQGVFLKDSKGVLKNAQKTTKAMRQWRMESGADIDELLLRQYVKETITNHKAGKEMKPERNKEYERSTFLLDQLASDDLFLQKFKTLTPGRQKEYHEYILTAKRTATKEQRVIKVKSLVSQGLGLNDKYKN